MVYVSFFHSKRSIKRRESSFTFLIEMIIVQNENMKGATYFQFIVHMARLN